MSFEDAERQVDRYHANKKMAELMEAQGGAPELDRLTTGCAVRTALFFGAVAAVFWIPAFLIDAVCRFIGVNSFWGLRVVVLGCAGACGYVLHREWSEWRQMAAAHGLKSVQEWRARRAGGPRPIPVYYAIIAVTLACLLMLMLASPETGVAGAMMSVLFLAVLAGLVVGGPLGFVIQQIDRWQLQTILDRDGELPGDSLFVRPFPVDDRP
jgi:hypothetical protein